MSTPIFDSTLLDHRDLLGTSLMFAGPVMPLYTAKNWIPAKRVEGWGVPTWPLGGTRITYEAEPKWRTFMRCLGWWKR